MSASQRPLIRLLMLLLRVKAPDLWFPPQAEPTYSGLYERLQLQSSRDLKAGRILRAGCVRLTPALTDGTAALVPHIFSLRPIPDVIISPPRSRFH